MKVLLFEHCFRVGGHRLSYASQVAQSVAAYDVQVALPSVLKTEPILRDYFSSDSLLFYDAELPRSSLQNARNGVRCLNELLQKVTPDHVLIPTADGLATLAGMSPFSSIRRTNAQIHIGLMIGRRPQAALSKSKQLINTLKWFSIRRGPWARILLMDPRSWLELAPDDRVLLGPDPVPEVERLSKQKARESLGLEENARWIVSPGNQDSRKGVPELIMAFCAAQLSTFDRLLLIGRLSDEVRETLSLLENHPNRSRIDVRDEFVDEAAFVNALTAADVVAALYRNTMRPSGVVSRCISWGIPVLARDAGWLRWAINSFQAGHLVDADSADALAQGIVTALKQSDKFSQSNSARSFADFNTESNYRRTWHGLIDPATNIPKPTFVNSLR